MTEIILSGKHRPNLTLQELLQKAPIDWHEQQGTIAPILERPTCHRPPLGSSRVRAAQSPGLRRAVGRVLPYGDRCAA